MLSEIFFLNETKKHNPPPPPPFKLNGRSLSKIQARNLFRKKLKIYNIYVHCRNIYNLFVQALGKQAFGELFWPVSQRV